MPIIRYLHILTLLLTVTFAHHFYFIVHYSNQAYSFLELARLAFWGLRFDLSISAMFSLLIYLIIYPIARFTKFEYHRIAFLLTAIAAISIVLLHGGDLMYYASAGRHPGYESLDSFNDAGELLSTAITVFPFVLIVELIIIVVIIVYCLTQFKKIKTSPVGGYWLQKILPEINLVGVLLLSVILIRGGFQSVPLEPLLAQEIGDGKKAVLVLNGAYNALFFLTQKDQVDAIPLPIEIHDAEILVQQLYQNSNSKGHSSRQATMSNTPPDAFNLVMILLEGWPASLMQSYGYEVATTPYFDELRQRSLSSYATLAGGLRTTEGMFAIFCSAQNPLGKTIAQSQLQNFQYRCLPHRLREAGYDSAFFQGSNRNTSGTGAFGQLLGFQNSFGKAHIKHRKIAENSWGVQDPDLYEFVVNKIDEMDQPFLVGINTNSTHDNQLPEGVKGISLGTRDIDKQINILNYADQSLQQFMRLMATKDYFSKTVFVLVADHTAGIKDSGFNKYRIPFLIYAPDIVKPQFINLVTTQRDIAPTILDILGLSSEPHFSGRSLLRDASSGEQIADYYQQGFIGWINEEVLMEFPIHHPENVKCFSYRTDMSMNKVVDCGHDIARPVNRALGFTAVLQNLLFSGRLLDFSKIKTAN
ncbi:MAG: LTA synthase family protein [Thiohalomonadales bacterium]